MCRPVSPMESMYVTTKSKGNQRSTSCLGRRMRDDVDRSQIKSAPAVAYPLSPPTFQLIISNSEPLQLYSRQDSGFGPLAKRTKLTVVRKACPSLMEKLKAEVKASISGSILSHQDTTSEPKDDEEGEFNNFQPLSTDKDHPRACRCLFAGYLRCCPDNYHAIDCGSSSCPYCADRPPGYDIWHVNHTAPDEDIFTEDEAFLSRTYDGQKNVLSLVISRELFRAMRNVVIEGRRYRKTKRRVDAELDDISRDMRPAWQEYTSAIANYKALKKNLRLTQPPLYEKQQRLKEAKFRLREAQYSYRTFKTRRLQLKSELRKAEHIWFSSFTGIDYYHVSILEYAGLVPEDKDKGWALDEYRYHRDVRSRNYGDDDVYAGEDTDTGSSANEASYVINDGERSVQAAEVFRDEKAEMRCDWMQHLAGLEVRVESARLMHEDVRNIYAAYFAGYSADNPGHEQDNLKDVYGPQYVQIVRKYINILQDAEKELETAREMARKAGFDPNAEHAYDLAADDNVQKSWIAREAQRLIIEVDRRKISR